MKIDAHIHLWNDGIPRSSHRQTPYQVDEVLIDMRQAGVDAAIIQPPAWDANANQIALAAAQKFPNQFGILGNFPLDHPDHQRILQDWKKQPGMLGLRYIWNEQKHLAWFEGSQLDWFWEQAQQGNIPIAIASSNHLGSLGTVAKRYPQLKLIIDHLGVPLEARDQGAFQQIPILEELAKYPNIAIKATAVPAYSTQPYPYQNIEHSVKTIFHLFGAERFFWGSDVTKLPCTWLEAVELFTHHYTWMSPTELDQVMGLGIAKWLDWHPQP